MIRRTRRWEVGIATAVMLAAIGLANRSGGLLLAAAIPLAYAAYGSVSTVSVPSGLVAERTLEPAPVPPGGAVTVTLTVRNEGERQCADLRIVDGVPERLGVVDGSPRAGVTLAPGESTTIEYVLVARRGDYDFEPPRVRVRGAGAGATATFEVASDGDTRLRCRLDADAPPLTDRGTGSVGTLTTDRAGRGIEFHSTRPYRPGDPASRIDWRHYAKRGELTTVNYAQQVAATVVLVLDARSPSQVVPGPGRPSGLERSAYAATQALTSLLRSGHDVAVAVVGLDGDGPAGLEWLPVGDGREQRERAIDLLQRAIDTEPTEADTETQLRRLGTLAPPGAHLTLFSPALDNLAVDAVTTWRAFDHPLIVLSPDVLSSNTIGGRYEDIRRRVRLAECQALGARTIDWRRGTPLAVALEHAFAASARLAGRGATGGVS